MRQTIQFNKDWSFVLGDSASFAEIESEEALFRKLDLPHDWSNDYELDKDAKSGGGGGYGKTGIGWYRKHFSLEDVTADSKYYLYFEGIYMDSTVYVNGREAGGHGYGYSSFYVDITDFIKRGENVVAVRVNNSLAPNSRWYSGSGIYRDVYLINTGLVHFEHFGVRCATSGLYPEEDLGALQIMAKVVNEEESAVDIGIFHKLYDTEGKQISVCASSLHLDKGECSDTMVRPTLEKPHLWTVEDPYLYTLVSTVAVNGREVDCYTCKIGIRTATFDSDKGFLLNGKQVKIKGMCLHHDCGLTGAVGYRETWERRLKLLKDMGCNGIRCAHNPPAPVFLDLCDELGFLVMDEVFDEWYLAKNKADNYYSENLAYGSSMFFKNHAQEDTQNMVRRDYNHPSVVLWSIGNEIPEQATIDGVEILNFLQGICHREDSSRMVTAACDCIASAGSGRTLRTFENALDVVGYNYVGRWRERAETFYEEDHKEFPKRRMIGSENPSAGGIRGNYSGELGDRGYYANATIRNEALWRYTAAHDFVAGDYLWTGIDYLGETRWPSRGSQCGALDTAGFKKDTYYYFRSIWNEKDVTLHIAPHWNFEGEEGVYKDVICYTNCDEVRLYVNGKYVGSKGSTGCPRYGATKYWYEGLNSKATTNDLHYSWTVAYEPGVVRAEGYRKGKLVAEKEIVTTGKMSSLKAQCYDEEFSVDKLVQIELSARDCDGRFVPDACPLVHCRIDGPARLVGMDGGDLSDLSRYTNSERRMFNGLLLAAIMPYGKGEVRISFETENGTKTEMQLMIP